MNKFVSKDIHSKFTKDDFGNYLITYPQDCNFSIRQKLNFNSQSALSSHRSGWQSVLNGMSHLHNSNGVWFESFVERSFNWFRKFSIDNKIIPIDFPWVGIVHNPPFVPDWYSSDLPLHSDDLFKNSLSNCLGIFTMSEYHASFLRNIFKSTPIESILHPHSNSSPETFDIYHYFYDKKILNIGYWLRKQTSFFNLDFPGHKKIKIWPYIKDSKAYKFVYSKLLMESERLGVDFDFNSIDHLYRLADKDYDVFLSQSIVFLDLWDTSANNVILECIERETPILCSRHPACVEYLGKDYPLFFDNYSQIELLLSEDNIKNSHEHLKKLNATKSLSLNQFIYNFENSSIYQSL